MGTITVSEISGAIVIRSVTTGKASWELTVQEVVPGGDWVAEFIKGKKTFSGRLVKKKGE